MSNNIIDHIKEMAAYYPETLELYMHSLGETICKDMKERIESKPKDPHSTYERSDTLLTSIHHTVERDGDIIKLKIYADGLAGDGQTPYAEFLEYGTGIHNVNGGGRNTPWIYADRYGNFHKTEGMEAYPFINPAVENALKGIDELFDNVTEDIRKYKGWSIND